MSLNRTFELNLLLTYRCNLWCRHCISDCTPFRDEAMSVESAKKYIDGAVQAGTCETIGFTGGEPFLRRADLEHLMRYGFERYGVRGGVVTNAYWAKNEKQTRTILTNLYNAGLRCLTVSCDDFHLRYIPLERIKRVVHNALELGIFTTVNVVVTRTGTICKTDIPHLLDLDEGSIGQRLFIREFAPLGIGRAAEQIAPSELISFENDNVYNGPCSFIGRVPTITPNGATYACCCFGDASHSPEAKIAYVGNANSTDIPTLMQAMRQDLLFSWIAETGPYDVLQQVLSYRSCLPSKRRYFTTCEICVELFQNQAIREALSGLLLEKVASLCPEENYVYCS